MIKVLDGTHEEHFLEKDISWIGLLEMLEVYKNFSEEEQTDFLHQLKESNRVKINKIIYEFENQDYINFKKYYGVAIK